MEFWAFLFILKSVYFKVSVLPDKNKLIKSAVSKLDRQFLGFYGLSALVFFAVFVGQYLYGSFAEHVFYYLALSMFFSAFFISKLITVLFELFYKDNHATVLFLTTLPRLFLFLLAFVFFKNTVHEEMNKNLILIAICVFFFLALSEAILKLKLFSRI